jgi:hypothetical protein
MAVKQQDSTKRVAISKANAQMVSIVAVAAFVTIFCLVASKAILSQNQYQSRVIKAKDEAHKQLEANIKAFDDLTDSYKKFEKADPNAIGKSRGGTGDNDGSNSKIILDALPSSYDFPALTSSLEKVLADRNLKVTDITGIDDQLNQQENGASPKPEPVSMPFSFTISDTNYAAVNQLISALQLSIRPLQVDTLKLSGGANDMTLIIEGHTYYQPGKSLKITKKVVK